MNCYSFSQYLISPLSFCKLHTKPFVPTLVWIPPRLESTKIIFQNLSNLFLPLFFFTKNMTLMKINAYSNAYVVEKCAICEPHNSAYSEEERKREGHELHTLGLYHTSLLYNQKNINQHYVTQKFWFVLK